MSNLNNHDPDWSPDGQHIVFANFETMGANFIGTIERIDADGSNRVPIFGPTFGQLQYSSTFSPDGSKIAFLDTELSSPFGRQLFVMDANGSNVQRFGAPFPFLEGLYYWSPDGTQIALNTVELRSSEVGLSTHLFPVRRVASFSCNRSGLSTITL